MLKHITNDPDDIELLESSYNAIKQKDCLEIVVDDIEHQKIFRQTVNSLTIPLNASFSFQNLFKLTPPTGRFYIAQCLVDFGYSSSGRHVPSSFHRYDYQLIGIANLKTDLGKTSLRPETKTDKLVSRFFDNDIDFNGSEKFNDKYYLVSNNKEQVHKAFSKTFINTIAKYKNVLLTARNTEMYISFETELNPNQSIAVEDIFCNFNFLTH